MEMDRYVTLRVEYDFGEKNDCDDEFTSLAIMRAKQPLMLVMIINPS